MSKKNLLTPAQSEAYRLSYLIEMSKFVDQPGLPHRKYIKKWMRSDEGRTALAAQGGAKPE